MTDTPFLSPPPTNNFYTILKLVYTHQTQLGWDHFLQGHIASTWGNAHNTYIALQQISTWYHSSKVLPSLILHLYNFGQKMWQNRNDRVHDLIPAGKKKTFTSHLNLTKDAYTDQSLITRQQDHTLLFHMPLDHLLQDPDHKKINWIATYQSCLSTLTLSTSSPHPCPLCPIFWSTSVLEIT